MSRNSDLPAIVSGLAAHPYLCTLGLCLFFEPLIILGAEQNFQDYALWLETFLVLGAVIIFGMLKWRAKGLEPSDYAVSGIAIALAILFVTRVFVQSETLDQGFAGGWAAVCIAAYILVAFLALRKYVDYRKNSTQMNALMILAMGFFIKLSYVIITSMYTRQHDVGMFDGVNENQANYIEYILYNNALPEFDVRQHWQFYHPPLHHAISAAWIYLNENILCTGFDAARESLQTLTLFYSMCIMISAYRIMRFFKLEGYALYIPLIIISFHPTFILFSGSINNDVLSVVFILGAILSTLEWYRKPTLPGIVKIALCVGLGMMAKISAAIVAPPIAVLFIFVLIKTVRKDRKKILIQFLCFGIICIPLGLWFGIRNYIGWGVPITYVPPMWVELPQHVGDKSYLSRITDFSFYQFVSPYVQLATPYAQGFTEFNPLTMLMKSSLFGEWNVLDGSFMLTGGDADFVAQTLFWINVILSGFALFAMIFMCVCKKENAEQGTEMIFLAGVYATIMVSFYKLAADYPFTSTMDFRYITPTAITGCVFIGLLLKNGVNNHKGINKTVAYLTGVATCFFAVFSGITYLSIV